MGLSLMQSEILDGVYKKYHPQMLKYTVVRCGSVDEAEDIVMEALGRIANRISEIPELARPNYWRRSILNIILMNQRRNQILRMESTDFEGDSIEYLDLGAPVFSSAEKELTRDVVREAILTLDKKYRNPLVGFYFKEQSLQDIASESGLPIGSIKSNIHRGRVALRQVVINSV